MANQFSVLRADVARVTSTGRGQSSDDARLDAAQPAEMTGGSDSLSSSACCSSNTSICSAGIGRLM